MFYATKTDLMEELSAYAFLCTARVNEIPKATCVFPEDAQLNYTSDRVPCRATQRIEGGIAMQTRCRTIPLCITVIETKYRSEYNIFPRNVRLYQRILYTDSAQHRLSVFSSSKPTLLWL
jgi:hypothetical protein